MPRNSEHFLKIGELAKRAGVSPRTIRFYVQERLLPAPLKTKTNMALYDPACEEMIKAIKRAQEERFLPLLAIRRILEQTGFDYAALADRFVDRPPQPAPRAETAESQQLRRLLIDELTTRRWAPQPDPAAGGEPLESFLLARLTQGLPWERVLEAMTAMEKLVEGMADIEFNLFFENMLAESPGQLGGEFEREHLAMSAFVRRVRERRLVESAQRHKRLLDNAIMAFNDEGCGIPLEEIRADLEALEGRIDPQAPDIEALNDLATGYSCAGDLERAIQTLRRVLLADPRNLDARIKMCWYQHLSPGAPDPTFDRDRLVGIVQENPEHLFGHVILARYYASTYHEADTPHQAFHCAQMSLRHVALAERLTPLDWHDWALLHYLKGLTQIMLMPALDHRATGIAAFEALLKRKRDLDEYYRQRRSYFPKWLWPNVHYFLGSALLDAGRPEAARESFLRTSGYRVSPLFREKVSGGLAAAEAALAAAVEMQCPAS